MAAAVTATVVAAAATVGEAADFLFPKPAGPSLQRRLPRDIYPPPPPPAPRTCNSNFTPFCKF